MPLYDDELVLFEIFSSHVPRLCRGVLAPADAHPLALADRVERKPDVFSDDLAFGRAHGPRLPRQVAAQKLAKRPLADEADPGRIALGEVVQAGSLGDPADFRLLHLSQRKHDARKLLLVQAVEEVALILGEIERLEKLEAPSGLPHPGIVPGGDAPRAEGDGVVEKRLELDLGVAQHVGIGSAARGILGEKRAEHALLVVGREIHHLEVDADDLGDRGAVDQILARRAVFVIVVVLPVLHEQADDLVPLALQEQRGDRRVDAPRHAHYDFFDRHGRSYATRRWFFRMNSAMRATPCSIAAVDAA